MQYGVIILKPDAIRDGLELDIQRDIKKANCDILFQTHWNICPQHVQIIHPDVSLADPYLPYMQRNYSQFSSMLLLVRYAGLEDIHEYLRRLKGSPENKGSIRYKYSIEESCWIDDSLLFNEEVDRPTVENRIHTPDNIQETINILRAFASGNFSKKLT